MDRGERSNVALLTLDKRMRIRQLMGEAISTNRELFNVEKPAFDAAIEAVDQWVENNAASYNLSLPLQVRTVLTTSQKSMLLLYVMALRFGKEI